MNSSPTLWPSEDAQSTVPLDHWTGDKTCLCLSPQCFAKNSIRSARCHVCGQSLLLKGQYRALREIGQGRFAKTYEAIDELGAEQPCVIKQFLPRSSSIDPQQLSLAQNLFQQEALILQRLGSHPQIPDLLAFINEPQSLFLVQEMVSGLSLYQLIQKTSQSADIDVEALLLEILPILSFIHAQEIVHRDIKLGNIIQSTAGRLWLIDFGAAYHKNLGRVGITGTLGYAAPEQLQGQSFPASDLYSLAVTCVCWLTRKILDTTESGFHAPHEFLSCLWEHSGRTIQPLVAQILEKMLQPELSSRYQSATEVLSDLQGGRSQASDVDYGRLKILLAEESYQEADQETWQLLLKLGDCLPHEMLTVDAIDRIPFADLRILDQLWSTASGGRFGFGTQLRLYQRQGAIRDFDYERWQAFAEQVGWCDNGQWAGYQDLDFTLESSLGQLPAAYLSLEYRQTPQSGPLGWWRLGFMSLMERFSLS